MVVEYLVLGRLKLAALEGRKTLKMKETKKEEVESEAIRLRLFARAHV